MSFRDIALPVAALGIPVTPLRANSKDAFLSDWPTSATTDPAQIELWDRAYGNINCGAVATGRPGDVWFFEADDPAIFEKIKYDTGFELLDSVKTYLVRSRQGRGHVYFRNSPLSMQMGNIPQVYGPFSVRQRNMYVVAAGSMHPHTQMPYECLTPGVAPAIAPDWFVQWLMDQRNRKSKDGDAPRDESGRVPHGFIHGWMVQQAGRLRNMGMDIEPLKDALLALVHTNCEPPIDDDKVRQVAQSFERYETNPAASLALNLNQQPDQGFVMPEVEEVELPTFDKSAYPEFPSYVWSNTSLYENFVKPICDHNSRIDYFMWMPAAAMMLNYLGTKVQIKGQFASAPFVGSQYMVLIGRRGESNKSSSIDDAMEYFKYIGCLTHNGGGLKTAEGKSVVWTAGSAEGLGIEMQKTNCKNAILFYDELSQLTKKAGIDGSTLVPNLLTMYEAKKFGNTVKTGKEAYSLEPNSYCFSLLTCCTDETFQDLWSKMNGSDTGLNDRFVFVLQPQTLPEKKLWVDVPYLENAAKTRFLIDKAIQQSVFEVENWNNPKLQALVPLGARYTRRAVKWALAIAVDLGLNIIDDECIDRGCDIVKYEIEVKDYLRSYDADTREAALQMRIREKLELHAGSLQIRELKRLCHFDRIGTTAWGQAFYGLQKAGIIRTVGKGTRSDPQVVQVLIKRDVEES